MFFLFLILTIVFLANRDSVRQARLNRDLAALRREKMEAVYAARRAQTRINQIETALAIQAAEEAAVYGGFIPLKDYAICVGSKADTVRRQCVRGAVPGAVKIGGKWYVQADASCAEAVPAATVTSAGRSVQVAVDKNTVCAIMPSAHEKDYPAREMTEDTWFPIIIS